MKLKNILCAIGLHYYDGYYWYVYRFRKNEDWIRIKKCVFCERKKID